MNNVKFKEFESYCTCKNNLCPFSTTKCFKLKHGNVGICSFLHNKKPQVVCPNLFLKFNFLDYIAKTILQAENYKILKELKVGSNFIDYVIATPENDFCGVEVQSLDTTGNYRWIFGEKVKPYCINWKTTKKTILSQLITKSEVFKNANKKIVLVIQDTFFDYLNIKQKNYDSNKEVIILSLSYSNKIFSPSNLISMNRQELIDLFCENDKYNLKEIVSHAVRVQT